ncbi:MAG TPA: transcriptional regulator [Treponema sp.]|nr:MAG: transcriptional regulator [Treponema sp. GWA1_62_8]OHE64779.1 MAG: transcriptional regulator [Treponema sp. GWC1_61_84]OHE71997.1 MAG: transcriptional regulator [Treponema sp. RIFOXYC1_FULL_61_9]HCM27623.1 transcriptional regulator [Treponema sp.]
MVNKKAEELFRLHGGQLRMSQALEGGTSRSVLYSLRDQGIIVQVTRGVYRLAELPEYSDPDLSVVSLRYPRAVICLVSALAFHDLTTQIPHEINIALPRGSRAPTLTQPPIRHFFFSGQTYGAGIQVHDLDGVLVRVYDPEKTLADCFRFRNKLGIDIFLEALKSYKEVGHTRPGLIMEYARICDVEKGIAPYLEAGL